MRLSPRQKFQIEAQIRAMTLNDDQRVIWLFDRRIRIVKSSRQTWVMIEHDPETGDAITFPQPEYRIKGVMWWIDQTIQGWPLPAQRLAVAI